MYIFYYYLENFYMIYKYTIVQFEGSNIVDLQRDINSSWIERW